MSDPGTVWLVVSGEYSNYTVWCAFETETLARDYIAEIGAVAGDHDPYSVSLNGDIIGERFGLRIERCQLWSTLPLVRITERHPATERDPAEMEIEPGIEMSEEPRTIRARRAVRAGPAAADARGVRREGAGVGGAT
jgi:hypothetical protein